MNANEISRATLGRILIYLKYLKELPSDVENISATAIARALNLGEVQVRKDLSSISGAGKPKIGYNACALTRSLEGVVGDKNGSAVIVGAGNLGRALLGYGGFSEYGIHILAAFDIKAPHSDDSRTGSPILPMEQLDLFCKENNVKIGVITVPAPSAQEVCDRLCKNGVKAIWSFAPCPLCVPKGVSVQYENIALSIAHLKTKIN